MPGETPGEKAVKIKDLGTVIHMDDLSREMIDHRARASALFEMKRTNGDRYIVHFVEGLGFAVVSAQTNRAFVMHCQPLIQLALEAGIEDQARVIIIPEVRRG